MWTDARQVAETLHERQITRYGVSWDVMQIAAHTFQRTAAGRGRSFGVERTRRALKELQANGYIRRRRSWGDPYLYWLTEEGIEWLRPKS